jgi:diamine N-acetyltransferase
MDIKLRAIDRSLWEACCALKVSEGQRNFVAPNAYSLAQAAYEPDTYPMGILADGALAGFVMYDFDSDANLWNMCRLMVDEKHQKKGIGEKAIRLLLDYVTARHGHVEFHTSAEPENGVAIALYEKLGFEKTGEMVGGEVDMKIQL